jgi:Phage tail protein.
VIESTIGGLTFSNESDSHSIETLDGWYSGPPADPEIERRPNANGAFGSTRDFKSPRVLTQTGLLIATDFEQAVTELWPQFSALQSDGVPLPFTVTDPSGAKSCLVTLSGPPVVQPIVDGLASYVLQLIARDPVKYGPAQTLSTGLPTSGGGLQYPLGSPAGALYYGALGNLGRVVLTNGGTAETWPTFEVTGELTSGFYLQCLESGDVLRYERIVPAGTSVSLDARTGEVLIDGVSDGSTYLVRGEWFSAAPGGVCTVQFNSIGASSGTPQLSATISNGYW